MYSCTIIGQINCESLTSSTNDDYKMFLVKDFTFNNIFSKNIFKCLVCYKYFQAQITKVGIFQLPSTALTIVNFNKILYQVFFYRHFTMDGTTIGQGGQWLPPNIFKKILLYIISPQILVILFYKITFCFPLIISLIFLKVMLYSQTFL